MPLTILASVSLLAFVVTARPLSPQDIPQLVQPSLEVRHAVQAILESRTGSREEGNGELFTEGVGVQVRLTSAESQSAYLAKLASDDVKLIIPVPDNTLPSNTDVKTLYNALAGLDDLDGGTRPLEQVLFGHDYTGALDNEVLSDKGKEEYLSVFSFTRHHDARALMIALVLSATSLLALLCIGTTLYVLDLMRCDILSGWLLCKVWPRVRKNLDLENGEMALVKKEIIRGVEENEKEVIIAAVAQSMTTDNSLEEEVSSRWDVETEDTFEDAIDYPDPDLLPLPTPLSATLDFPLTRSPRALELAGIAADSPHVAPLLLTLEPIDHPGSRRAYRDPIPEVELAIVMQIRRALGLGVDAAWLVQCMMGMFGWFRVLFYRGRQ